MRKFDWQGSARFVNVLALSIIFSHYHLKRTQKDRGGEKIWLHSLAWIQNKTVKMRPLAEKILLIVIEVISLKCVSSGMSWEGFFHPIYLDHAMVMATSNVGSQMATQPLMVIGPLQDMPLIYSEVWLSTIYAGNINRGSPPHKSWKNSRFLQWNKISALWVNFYMTVVNYSHRQSGIPMRDIFMTRYHHPFLRLDGGFNLQNCTFIILVFTYVFMLKAHWHWRHM